MLNDFLAPVPKTVEDLFNGLYKIPIMQRDYAWKERQVIDLLEDVQNSMKDLEDEDQYYFIGSMVCSLKSIDDEKSEREYVIDGQQRLITLTLIISAARYIFRFKKFFSSDSVDIDNSWIEIYDDHVLHKQKIKKHPKDQKKSYNASVYVSKLELQNSSDNDFLGKSISKDYIFNSLEQLVKSNYKTFETDISMGIKDVFKIDHLKIICEKILNSIKKLNGMLDYETETLQNGFHDEVKLFIQHVESFKKELTLQDTKIPQKELLISDIEFVSVINIALIHVLQQMQEKLIDFSFKDIYLAPLMQPYKLNKKEIKDYLANRIAENVSPEEQAILDKILNEKIHTERTYYKEYAMLQKVRRGDLKLSNLSFFEQKLLESISSLDSDLFLFKNKNITATQRKIYEAQNTAYKFMKDMDMDDITDFIDYMLERVSVVKMTAKDFSSAFRIFETINDRGLGLSPEDLLKNLILRDIDDIHQRQNISLKWDEFKNTFLNKKEGTYSTSIPNFLKHYIMSSDQYISKNKIFKHFKDKYNTKDIKQIESLVNELLSNAKAYKAIIEDNTSLLNKLNFKQGYIVQLSMSNLPSNIREEINSYLYNLAFVFFITNSRTNELEHRFVEIAKLLRQLENNNDNSHLFREVINKIKSLYLDKKELFNESLLNFIYDESKPKHIAIVKFLLETISYEIDGLDFKSYTIEHIINAMRNQENLPESYKTKSQKLGNLTLLLPNDNSSLNNVEDFEEKQKVYSKCACTITRSLGTPVLFEKNTKQRIVWDKYNFKTPSVFDEEEVVLRTKALIKLWNHLFFD